MNDLWDEGLDMSNWILIYSVFKVFWVCMFNLELKYVKIFEVYFDCFVFLSLVEWLNLYVYI